MNYWWFYCFCWCDRLYVVLSIRVCIPRAYPVYLLEVCKSLWPEASISAWLWSCDVLKPGSISRAELSVSLTVTHFCFSWTLWIGYFWFLSISLLHVSMFLRVVLMFCWDIPSWAYYIHQFSGLLSAIAIFPISWFLSFGFLLRYLFIIPLKKGLELATCPTVSCR